VAVALLAVALVFVASAGPPRAAGAGLYRAFYVVDYSGKMTGRLNGRTAGRGVTNIYTEKFSFSLSCASAYPGPDCELRGTMDGLVTGTYPGTPGTGNCSLAFGLKQPFYNQNPLTTVPFNDFGRVTPLRHFGASPLMVLESQYWSRQIPVQTNGGCPGWFGWDSSGRSATASTYSSRATINIDTGAGGFERTIVTGHPTVRDQTGFSRYTAQLNMQLLSDPYYWWAESAGRAIQDLIQGLVNASQTKQPTGASLNADMPGLTSNASHAVYSADGTLTGFKATTGGLGRSVRRAAGRAANTIRLFSTRTQVTTAPTTMTVVLTPAGRAALAALTAPATVHVTATIAAPGRPARSAHSAFTVTPVGSPVGTITSVQFAGSPADPAFIVRGSGLGKKPNPDPSGYPAGTGGCPALPSDDGYDYGTNLYIAVAAKGWSAGRYDPSTGETDCVDLVVTKFTPSEVDFHLGPFYSAYHSKFSINDGDVVQIAVNGAEKTAHVKYGATTTS
jgi:hypothetical protein